MNTAQIRRLLNQAFDDSGLDAFCHDYFPNVFDNFGRGMGKNDKITKLLDHCRRTPNGFKDLRDAAVSQYKKGAQKEKSLEMLIDGIDTLPDMSSYSVTEATETASVTDIQDKLKRIKDPFIREMEETLRTNKMFWQEAKIQSPMLSESFTQLYFSEQSNRVSQLDHAIMDLYQQIKSAHLGKRRFSRQAMNTLKEVKTLTSQLARLMALVSQSPQGIALAKANSLVVANIQDAENKLSQAILQVARGTDISYQLRLELRTRIHILAMSLDKLRVQLDQISREAGNSISYLN